MYLLINNYYTNNIFLYQNLNKQILCKNNFSYQLIPSHTYHKMIVMLSNSGIHTSSINIIDSNKIKLSINPSWCLPDNTQTKITKHQNIIRNILLPNNNDIQLAQNHSDLTSLNCLCHDQTRILNIPDIHISIDNKQYIFDKWIGNNQIWCAFTQDGEYFIYAYLYIFYNHSILLVSKVLQEPEINLYYDLDLCSRYDHTNMVYDEYGRIDCSNYNPSFSDIQILNTPINSNPPAVSISTKCHHHTA